MALQLQKQQKLKKQKQQKDRKRKMAEGKKKEKKTRGSKLWKAYEVKGSQLVRVKKFSPKAGTGFFMAEHKNRRTCGKTGYMEKR